MKTGGKKNVRSTAMAVLLAVIVAASACSASSAEIDTAVEAPAVSGAPTEPADSIAEPTPVLQAPSEPESDQPLDPSEPIAQPVDFGASPASQAISNDGVYAYSATTSHWDDATPCDAEPFESLAVVEIAQAAAGDVAPVGAGLEQRGDIRQLLFGEGAYAVIVSSCGSVEESTVWIQRVDFGADGRIVELGEVIAFDPEPGEGDPHVIRWVDADIVEVQVLVEPDPDDFESWLVDRRQISTSTGAVVSSEQLGYDDDRAFARDTTVVSADGRFTYRSIDDPAGSLGCEGFGVSRTISVEAAGESRLALGEGAVTFADVSGLHFSPGGYVAWTSGCEGFLSAYVGRTLADGSIADAHWVDVGSFDQESFFDFRAYRLTNDGFLAAVGFRSGDGPAEPAFLRYELSSDPHFVNTADPAINIDPEPLFEAANGTDTWHLGETLGANPGCGASTLYGRTPAGFVRAFPAVTELDEIVDVDVTETERFVYDDGSEFLSRTVVVSTACPGQYEGVRVWFGTENGNINWGLHLRQANLGEVAEVIAIREQRTADGEFVEAVLVEVRLPDGAVIEVPLVEEQ